VNPGYEDNFKVFKLRLENWPRRQEVDSLAEAFVDVEQRIFMRDTLWYHWVMFCSYPVWMAGFNVPYIIFDNPITHLAFFTRASIESMLTHNFCIVLPGESRL
jgi:hypothetical protein